MTGSSELRLTKMVTQRTKARANSKQVRLAARTRPLVVAFRRARAWGLSRSIARRFSGPVPRTLALATVVSFTVVGVDVLARAIESPWQDLTREVAVRLPGDERKRLAAYLLVGVPSVLFVTLTSFAVPALAQYLNPAVLLLLDRPRGTFWRLSYLFGRANSFWLAQSTALALGAAVLTYVVWVDADRGVVPVLALLAGLAVLSFYFLLHFTYEVLRLRTPSEAVEETAKLGLALLSDVQKRRAAPLARTVDPLPYLEQRELVRVVDALQQLALRTRLERQVSASTAAIDALSQIADRARSDRIPSWWFDDGTPTKRRWFDSHCISCLGSLLVESARAGDSATCTRTADALLSMSLRLLDDERPTKDEALLRQIFAHYRDALVVCSASEQHLLGGRLIGDLSRVAGNMADRKGLSRVALEATGRTWQDVAALILPGLLGDLGAPLVERDDAGATRDVLSVCSIVLETLPELRSSLTAIAVDLTASALCRGSYRSAVVLSDWIRTIPGVATPDSVRGVLFPGGKLVDESLFSGARRSADYVDQAILVLAVSESPAGLRRLSSSDVSDARARVGSDGATLHLARLHALDLSAESRAAARTQIDSA